LDVSKNINLSYLDCSNNQLISLNAGSPALSFLNCSGNQLSNSALDNLFITLRSGNPYVGWIWIGGNPGTNTCNQDLVRRKGWWVYD